MKTAGYALFVAGVIVSSCFAARAVSPVGTGQDGQVTSMDRISAWASVAGAPFGVGVVLMLAGGVLARRRRSAGAGQGTEHLGGAPEGAVDRALEGQGGGSDRALGRKRRDPAAIMGDIRDKLATIAADPDATQTVFSSLDDIVENDVAEFLEHRQALIDDLGLAKFAEMIGHFAMMERNVARAWSAITDGALGEVPNCIERAQLGIEMAEATFRA
jgi:hypothetical protein